MAGAGAGPGVSGRALGWVWRVITFGRGPVAPFAVADFDAFQVKRGERQLDLASGQGGFDLVGVDVQRPGGGFGDRAQLGPQKRLGQRAGAGHDRAAPGGLPAVVPAGQGCLSGLQMHLVVIDGLHPGGEQGVELEQAGGRGELRGGQLLGASVVTSTKNCSPRFSPRGAPFRGAPPEADRHARCAPAWRGLPPPYPSHAAPE